MEKGDDEDWTCCYCHPTRFLVQLQTAHDTAIMGSSTSSPNNSSSMNDDNDDANNNADTTGDHNSEDDHDECITKLLHELDYAEYCLADATHRLEESTVESERERIELELIDNGTPLDTLASCVQSELEVYMKRWMLHFDRFSDSVGRLQDELDSKEVGVMQWYYKSRDDKRTDEDDGVEKLREEDDDEDVAVPSWKITADLANGEFQCVLVSPFSLVYQFSFFVSSSINPHPRQQQTNAMKRRGITRASFVVLPATTPRIRAC